MTYTDIVLNQYIEDNYIDQQIEEQQFIESFLRDYND